MFDVGENARRLTRGPAQASETANEELAEQRLRAQELEGHLRASERKLSAAEKLDREKVPVVGSASVV